MNCPQLDAEFEPLVKALSDPGLPTIRTAGPAAMRALLSQLSPTGGPELKQVRDVEFGGVRGREYLPHSVTGTIVFYHGGGWVIGSVSDYDFFARTLAETMEARVLSVEYRLAPEHPFPAAAEDAWAFLRAVEPSGPLFVAGDSAGGNLAAVVAHMARDAGGPRLAGQILLYPAVSGDSDGAALHDFEPPIMTRDDIAAYYDLAVPDRSMRRDPRFAPALGSPAGLPPALIITAGADLLAYEAEEYGVQLLRAGVPVQLHRAEGVPHAFMTLAPDSRAARTALKHCRDFVDVYRP
ncbi:alpha/beta hydrolase [Burkholderia sp. Bp9142]|nr:alpha/beta hydrolase [Burkholderia sp. Bp9142]